MDKLNLFIFSINYEVFSGISPILNLGIKWVRATIFLVEFKITRTCRQAKPIKSTSSPFWCMELAKCGKVFSSLSKHSWLVLLNDSELVIQISAEDYLEPRRRYTIELFCKNSKRLLAIHYFRKSALL